METALDLAATAASSAAQPSVGALSDVQERAVPGDSARVDRDVLTALAQSQAALARGIEALNAEIAGLALSGIETAARTATKMLGVKTLSDAIEVNAGFTCGSFDTLIGGSAKLSELGMKLAREASQPILSQLGKNWMAPRRGS